MKCEDIRRHFSEYIDLEAPEEIASAIEEHVAACGECRRELESCRKVNAAIASVGEEELPFDFSVTLQANLEEEKKKGRSRSRSKSRPWLRALAACACLMLVLGVFSLGSSLFGLSMGASAAQDAPASAPMAYAMNSPMKFMDMAVTEDAAPMEEYIIAERAKFAENFRQCAQFFMLVFLHNNQQNIENEEKRQISLCILLLWDFAIPQKKAETF